MKNAHRKAAVVVVGLVMVVVVLAGTGSACVPQPKLVVLRPNASGPSNAKVTVDVLGLDPGPAEVRWNSVDGALLAQASGPDFSAPIEIPTSPDGLYNVVVLSRFPSGSIGNTAIAGFLVTGGQAASVGGSTPKSTVGAPLATASSESSGLSTGAGLAIGGGFLALGLLGGVTLARRRPTQAF